MQDFSKLFILLPSASSTHGITMSEAINFEALRSEGTVASL